ncbi:hypothetical protein ACFOY4_42465 [Actinomadura syzygii]|uniref:hypothetical protein n=1 Tax=Actinomadura syzygii TaxID=1427538 RepID=UPI001FE2F966|nr:hypothetical protein [Actinomadura syzygii]
MDIRRKAVELSRRVVGANRRRALILGSAGVLVLALVGGGVAFLLATRGELQYKTQSALRKALPVTAAAELEKRGVSLSSPLKCKDLPGWTKSKLRVSCTGTTTDQKSVEVLGTGEEKTHKSYYTILVDGRPVVENAHCLGADCKGRQG